MSGYKVIMGVRCEEARKRMIDHMVRRVKEVIPRHDTIIFNLVTLNGDAKMIKERLRERIPDVEVTVDVGNATKLIIRCKKKEHFPTLSVERGVK